MKIASLIFCLIISSQIFSQGNQVELPYEDGKVVYRKHVNSDEKKSALFQSLVTWVENEKSLSEVKIDHKNLSVEAKGTMIIPTKRSKDEFTYKFNAVVKNGKIDFWYERILYVEIDQLLEVLIEKNEGSDRRTVQENLKFIKLGVHSNINAHARALKASIKGN